MTDRSSEPLSWAQQMFDICCAPHGQVRARKRALREAPENALGRWPANVLHDGSDEVIATFPAAPGQQHAITGTERAPRTVNAYGDFGTLRNGMEPRGDAGSAARYFYSAKADAEDRFGSKHPTVKPVELMRWLIRLVTPPGGTVLDPFAGSGTTGAAAMAEKMSAILIEREAGFVEDIKVRIAHAEGRGAHSAQVKNRMRVRHDAGPLFIVKGATE